MPWERLELLLRRIAQDVEGLRDVQVYGARGQSQYGIDVAGTATDGSRHAFQGKRYETFTAADLTKAVQTFIDKRGSIPFPIIRLVVVAGCLAERTAVTNELYRLQDLHVDVRIELWHQRDISDKLRNRPDIVVEFFGEAAAEAFCLPVTQHVVAPPPPDRVRVADALVHGPAEITSADVHLIEAARVEAADPAAAVAELERAGQLLEDGGFAAHAAVVLERRATLLGQAGEHDRAARLLCDAFWPALDGAQQDHAHGLSEALASIAASDISRSLARITELAVDVVRHPLGAIPRFELAEVRSDTTDLDAARLVLLIVENAAVDPMDTWRRDHVAELRALADAAQSHGRAGALLACRLRIEVAEVTGDWTDLLDAARKQRVRRDQAVLIFARNGVYNAERGQPEQAEGAWQDAMTQACLDGQDNAAAEHVFSRQILRIKYGSPMPGNDQQLIRSLRARSTSQPRAERLEDKAMRALLEGKPAVAVALLRGFHRAAYSAGAWGQMLRARKMLADAYSTTAEPMLAVRLYALAGQLKKAAAVAKNDPNVYLDVRDTLESPAYWVAGTGYQIVAVQADLVPDNQVTEITGAALIVLDDALAGTLQDTTYSTSVKANAFKALSMLADRMPVEHAWRVLEHTRPWVPRKTNHHRHTDDDHVRACARIATAHPELRADALDQLMDLIKAKDSGVAGRAEREVHDLVQQHPDLVRDRLTSMTAESNQYAARLLGLITTEPTTGAMAAAAAAANRLATPPRSTPHSVGIGTGAPDQALLARPLPADQRRDLARQQLVHAGSPYEPGTNRAEYYEAARFLAYDVDEVDDLFDTAMLHALNRDPSRGDVLHNSGSHPLSSFRVVGFPVDTRTNALWLAAMLARTGDQKQRVRELAYTLIGSSEGADWYVAHTLKALELSDADRDLPLLASQPHWALRSLAALTWAATLEAPVTIGHLLAEDSDPRVRRALASTLSTATNPTATEVRTVLADDPCHSVRELVESATRPASMTTMPS
jgi:hypothetical protein